MKTMLLRVVQVLVTAGVLVWVFRDPQLRAGIPVVLRRAEPLWLVLGVAVAGIGELANIVRWQIFLRMQKVCVPLLRTGVVFMIGVFFSIFCLGVVGGDVARAAYLCADQEDRKAGVILSVVIDRLIGMLVLIPFSVAVVAARFRWFQQSPSASALFWFLIVFLIAMTAFLAIAVTVTLLGASDKLPGWAARQTALMRVIRACALFGRSWREFFITYALSVPVLFAMFATFYCAARAFGAPLTLADMFSIMPIVTVVTSLPVSVSGIGVREGLFKHLLGDLTGTPAEVGVLISLAGFLAHVVWCLAGAVAFLFARPTGIGGRPEAANRGICGIRG